MLKADLQPARHRGSAREDHPIDRERLSLPPFPEGHWRRIRTNDNQEVHLRFQERAVG
jgi:hypothetical protein